MTAVRYGLIICFNAVSTHLFCAADIPEAIETTSRSGKLGWMLDERVLIPNSERSEVLLIVREHDQIVLPSCGSNRDILETGRDASAAGDCHELPGYRCRLEIKRQNAATVVVTNFSPPFSECCRFFAGTGSLGVRNTVLDLSRGDYGQPKVGRSLDYPGN